MNIPQLRSVESKTDRRERIQRQVRLIPSLVTMTGTFCGFLATIYACTGQFESAAKCIALAILLDGLDGRLARRLNATSDFGRELDSLSDMLAFGVAPGCLMYFWGLRESADEFGIVACFLYVVCTAIRLARFNVTPSSADAKSAFCGLPSPGAAAAVAALIYAFPNVEKTWLLTFIAWAYTVMLGGLMVSTFEYISVKSVKITKAKLWYLYVLLALAVPICWKYNREAAVTLAALYAFSGPISYAFKRFNHRGHHPG